MRSANATPPTRAHIGPMFVAEFGIAGVYGAVTSVMPHDRRVVLDAIRSAATVRELRRCHHDIFVLHVDAPEDVRRARLQQRIASWTNSSGAEQAYEALNSDSAWCAENADAVIWNDVFPNGLRAKLEHLALTPAR